MYDSKSLSSTVNSIYTKSTASIEGHLNEENAALIVDSVSQHLTGTLKSLLLRLSTNINMEVATQAGLSQQSNKICKTTS